MEEFELQVIDHAVEYSNRKIHTHGMENFWSLLKRSLNGTYVSLEPFHLFRHVDKQAFRYNNRQGMNDSQRFDLVAPDLRQAVDFQITHWQHRGSGAGAVLSGGCRATRYNGIMPHLARGIAHAGELVEKLNFVQRFIPPEVVKWDYTFDTDWSGDPAIFFRVVLTDAASDPQTLGKATTAFTNAIAQNVDPFNDWDLLPYYSFRSQSEQANLKDEVVE
jgi:hypothetical protein